MRFDELGLDADILRSLEAMNFEEMTPVQEHTIPIILENKDLIGCAQTGTGKTAAYTLPLLDKLLREGNPDNVVKSLIVVPTRELAQQIDVQFQGFSYFLPLSTTVVYGGGDGIGWEQQKQGMLRGSDIVVATPGRLLAHIANSGIDLSHVSYFVLDEADRMLDMGFFDDIMKIIKELPTERQTIMFSATLPPKIRQMAKQILRNPAEVNIAVSKPNEAIQQGIYVCYENQKMEIVRALFGEPTGTKTIIFSSSKQKVKELAYTLKRMKLNAAAMHSDLEQEQREEVMLDFKKRQNRPARSDGHRRARDRHRRYRHGGQLRRTARPGGLHPPHRTHGARERNGPRDHLRQRKGAGQVPPHRNFHGAGCGKIADPRASGQRPRIQSRRKRPPLFGPRRPRTGRQPA